tara:strand:- start:1121 stop:1423 length:303 start_codon:yes stop_codon:yes gene_type:complete
MFKKLKKNYFVLIISFLILYFLFNLLNGERGLISLFQKKNILKDLNEKKIELSIKINDLELKNSLLKENIDLDFIEILIRDKFIFGKPNEKIYIKKDYEN